MICNDTMWYPTSTINIFLISQISNFVKQRLKDVSLIVRVNPLHDSNNPFKTHTCVDMCVGERVQLPILITIVLNEHKIPKLSESIGHIHSIFRFSLKIGVSLHTKINKKLRTRATRTCLSHFPEIFLFVKAQNTIDREVSRLNPHFLCFIIIKINSGPQLIFRYFPDLGNQFPSETDSLTFVIITKGPIP